MGRFCEMWKASIQWRRSQGFLFKRERHRTRADCSGQIARKEAPGVTSKAAAELRPERRKPKMRI